MNYRLNKENLLKNLSLWNQFLRRKVHLIACGGTALTLLGIKESTKDIDFMVPDESEYKYLIQTIKNLGYNQVTGFGWAKKGQVYIFDLFPGKRIHTTELLVSPLEKEKNTLIKDFSSLYIGVLNDYDLIASKIFRGTSVDFEDCLALIKARKDFVHIPQLEGHLDQLASYDISEDKIRENWEYFLQILRENDLYER